MNEYVKLIANLILAIPVAVALGLGLALLWAGLLLVAMVSIRTMLWTITQLPI